MLFQNVNVVFGLVWSVYQNENAVLILSVYPDVNISSFTHPMTKNLFTAETTIFPFPSGLMSFLISVALIKSFWPLSPRYFL